ncbi:MAG: hypothetical protein F6K56_14890 [Moorea sp. SIO3G5]|nr:hypothetical protein [Moorena sp. SIO3G5]
MNCLTIISSLFPVPCSLFPDPKFPTPCSLLPKNMCLTQLKNSIGY